jgi:signal transduction histidine kinase
MHACNKDNPRKRWHQRAMQLLLLCVCSFFAGCTGSEGSGGEAWFVRLFSPALESIEKEVQRIEGEQALLPDISLEVSGGTGGLATFAEGAFVASGEPERTIEVFWGKPELIDLVALAPARDYSKRGAILDYGLPDDFSVELIGEDGEALPVATERGVRASTIREGYPFTYSLESPILAIGLRVKVQRVLPLDIEGAERYLFAFSEVYCFSAGRNVAFGADVSTPHKSNLFIHWHWQNLFLVDGQSPMGLPELPSQAHSDIGWLSNARQNEDQPAWIVVDLGSSRQIDEVNIFPIRLPSLGHFSGFGMPRCLQISVSASNEPGSYNMVYDQTSAELSNPGQNPFAFSFESVEARFVKFEVTKLWKPFINYPAFLALSEIQILSDRFNQSEGAQVFSSDQRGRIRAHEELFWSEASLTDGYSSRGQLMRTDAWLLGLDQRLQLEREKSLLLAEAESITASIRQNLLTAMLLLGGGGLFFSIFIPIRYRLRRKRDNHQIRQRIAGDLHDEVGSNLGCIQVFSELLQQQLPASQELRKIRRISAETVTAVRDIVWLLRAKTNERVCIAEHLRESSEIMLDSLDWSFEADASFSNYKVDAESARNWMLFYREALHNVLRHAQARKVSIRLDRMGAHVRLRITDDGCGIPPERLAFPENLYALKERVKRLKGEFEVLSEPGNGTTVQLML